MAKEVDLRAHPARSCCVRRGMHSAVQAVAGHQRPLNRRMITSPASCLCLHSQHQTKGVTHNRCSKDAFAQRNKCILEG